MKSAKRKTIMIDGVRYYAERPHDCRKCFFWENRKESVPNAELKEMVEAYKTRSPQKRESGSRESAREKLDSLAKETAAKLSLEGKKAKPKVRGPEH